MTLSRHPVEQSPGLPSCRELSYRPYFRNSAIDRVERFYGIGTVDNNPGYYLATALHENGVIVGTGVVKISLDQLESGSCNRI